MKQKLKDKMLQPETLFVVSMLAFVVALIYGRSLWYGYVNFDDTLIKGADWIEYRKFGWQGLKNIFTFRGASSYQPLRHLSLSLIYEICGTKPWGYHLFNVIFYFFNSLALYFLLIKIQCLFHAGKSKTATRWLAAGGALLFTVMPVHVESVAWMVSNKEVLAGLFGILSFSFYLDSRGEKHSLRGYLLSWFFYVFAMLSKPSVAALPLFFIVLEMVVDEKTLWTGKKFLRILPFGLVTFLGAFYFVFASSARAGFLQDSLSIHFLSIASVLAKYVVNLAFPVNLCSLYPPPFFSGDYNWRLSVYILIDLVLIALLVISVIRKKRLAAIGLLFFLINLIPVSGIIPISIFMADRYLFFPSVGIVIACIGISYEYYGKLSKRSSIVFVSMWIMLIAAQAVLSGNRLSVWRDAVSLWSSAVETYPNFQVNHHNLGLSLMATGEYDKALASFKNSLKFKENQYSLYNVARIYDIRGDSAAADSIYRYIIKNKEESNNYEDFYLKIYSRLGMWEETTKILEKMAIGQIDSPVKFKKTVSELLDDGRFEVVAGIMEKAISSRGGNDDFLYILALCEVEMGNYRRVFEILDKYQDTISGSTRITAWRLIRADALYLGGQNDNALDIYRNTPENKMTVNQLERYAACYYSRGSFDSSLAVFRSIAGSFEVPRERDYNNIGVVFEALGQPDSAVDQYESALRLEPEYSDARYNLGNVQLKIGNPEAALSNFRKVMEQEGFSPEIGVKIANAAAAAGQNEIALDYYNRVLIVRSNDLYALIGKADLLWKTGRKSEGRKFYEKVEKLADESFDIPDRVKKRVK